tara:strand:- start:565 stop:1002 length:438 start_codon:yes stop_codon:yes gene_type:complete
MMKILKLILFSFFIINIFNIAYSKEEYFKKGLELYKDKKYDDAKFMFEKSIVFNPKNSRSYLYLAKIYNYKEDRDNEEKNLSTTLLIEPENEEAILMLMKVGLKKSNYSKVKELSKKFSQICKKLCNENKKILENLDNLEPKNDS